jgi:RHS repeat-associated protein
VTSVIQAYDKKPHEGATTRFSYVSATETQVADANQDLSKAVGAVPHTTYTINGEKRVTKTVDPAGKERDKTYTPFHDVASATDATDNTTTNTYGANGGQSLTASASATGSKTTATYANAATPTNPTGNFQPSSSTDTQNNSTAYTYNGAGNKLSSKDALAAEAKVEYNDDGTVQKATDPNNGSNGTTYTYNADKQLTKITAPTGNSLGVREFTYDEFGRMHTFTDGAGRTTTYEYDLDDRVVKTAYSDKTVAVSYTYDGAGNMYAREDADGHQNFWYDRLNRLVERNGSQWYGYDPVGNLVELSDGRGTTYYEYDTRNLLKTMFAGQADYSFEYDDDGRRTYTRMSMKKAGSPEYTAETHNTFDKSGRLSRTTTKRWQKVDGAFVETTVFDVSYCYAKRVGTAACSTASADDTGIRQWQTDHHRNGAVTVYTFDKGNRLTKATNIDGKTYDYTYDSNGNRKTVAVDGANTQTLAFNSANQITTGGYAYDAAGNQTSGSAVRGATYNGAEQTRTNKDAAGNTTTFNYAGPDQVELSYTEGPEAKDFWWGLSGQAGQSVLQFYKSGDWHEWHYIERDNRQDPLGHRVFDQSGERHYFYVLDGLGSVVGLIDDTGAHAGSRTYDPYGRLLKTVAGDDEIHHTVLGFGGGLVNGELTKFGRRWYDPNTGRFTQQDSVNLIGDPRIGNRYAFAGDNPVNYADPSGNLLSALASGIGDALWLMDVASAADNVSNGDWEGLEDQAWGLAAGLATEVACNFALGMAAPLTAGASALGTVGCAVLGTAVSSEVEEAAGS